MKDSSIGRSKFVENALKRGHIYEPVARIAYCTHFPTHKVTTHGIKAYKNLKHEEDKMYILGGSPDGIIEDHKTLLEIKCPYHKNNQMLPLLIRLGHLLQMIVLMEIYELDKAHYMWYLVKTGEYIVYELDRQTELFEEWILPGIHDFIDSLKGNVKYKPEKSYTDDVQDLLTKVPFREIGRLELEDKLPAPKETVPYENVQEFLGFGTYLKQKYTEPNNKIK